MNKLLLFVFSFHCLTLIAQKGNGLEDIIEQSISDNENAQLENDILYYYLKHPIKLDVDCGPKLRELAILDALQLKTIELHILNYGKIRAIEELMRINGMDLQSVLRIKPFISTDHSEIREANSIDKSFNHLLRSRWSEYLQKSKGFGDVENGYKGSPQHLNLRYQSTYYSKLETGINLEKDAGEVIWSGERKVDFISAYLSLKDFGRIQQVIIGDYGVNFGQGLTFSTMSGLGKTSEVLLIAKQFNDIRPHRSNSEFNFLRGIASTWQFGTVSLSQFISLKKIDASLIEVNSENKINSLQQSGLHRTENELQKSTNVREEIAGLNVLIQKRDFEYGLIAYHKNYSMAFNDHSEWHKRNNHVSKESMKTGMHFSLEKSNYHLFGEFSKGLNSGHGLYSGVIIMFNPVFSFALSYRSYAVNFPSAHSTSFGEKRDNTNEDGLYAAYKLKLKGGRFVTFYCDQYRHKYPEFSSKSPSSGIDYVGQMLFPLSRDDEMLIRLKWEEKEKDLVMVTDATDKLFPERKRSLRIQYIKTLNKTMRWRFRMEFSDYFFDINEMGNLIFNELKYKKMMSPWTLLGRFTIFDTESHKSAIYAYEQGVTGSFSVPAFSGKGSKVLLVVKYKWRKFLSFSTALGHLIYEDRKTIGSGLDEIEGSTRTSLTCQLEMKF